MKPKLIIDYRYCDIAKSAWGAFYDCIPSAHVENSAQPVCGHPDMQLVVVGQHMIVRKECYSHYSNMGIGIQIGGEAGMHYPEDVAYNVLIVKKHAFARADVTDSVIKRYLQQENIPLHYIKQGYAKCSACVAGDGVITHDPSVFRAMQTYGIDVLFIREDDIVLPGYNTGFIGGATGMCGDKILFFGDITKHKDWNRIQAFLQKRNLSVRYIPDYPLTDVGSIIEVGGDVFGSLPAKQFDGRK